MPDGLRVVLHRRPVVPLLEELVALLLLSLRHLRVDVLLLGLLLDQLLHLRELQSGGNCINIGLPGKSILSKRKGLLEVLFS